MPMRLVDSRLPSHIAIIMDGNGRWARTRSMPRILGHRAGIRAVRRIVKACTRKGISYLTLYAFSSENWKRPEEEVVALMHYLAEYLDRELPELMKQRIRLSAIGRLKELPELVQRKLAKVMAATSRNRRMTLTLALNYGGRAEILDACRTIARKVQRKQCRPDEIDEPFFAEHLYTDGMPDPDLMLRTSGEMRVSNFLLWQISYSELYITKTLWPDFTVRELERSLAIYQRRERRFGGY